MSDIAPPELLLAGSTISSTASARLRIDGRDFVSFFGSGYLALSGVPEIRRAVLQALERGAPFCQQVPAAVLGGADPLFDDVEEAGALACGTEHSLYFACGSLLGAVAVASADPHFDLVLLDEHAHFNLCDAARLSGRPVLIYSHCDADALHDTLKHAPRGSQRPLVMTDGVFATTGRIPPLAAYAAILAPYGGQLLVDESHAFGVVGPQGRGAAEHCGVSEVAITGTTLSKAMCAHGALMGCSAPIAARVRVVPPLRGSNAGSPLSAAAAAACLRYVARRPQLRQRLAELTRYLRARLRDIGLDIAESPAPIVAFRIGSRADMLALQKRLFTQGFFIHYSTYLGSGSDGTLRCAVFRDHSRSDIDAFVDALGR